MTEQMAVKKDLKCGLNMPEKISSAFAGGGETSHGLPPYALVDAYPVDEYEACPTNWEHGSDVASSYFVGVKEDHGMWLDFNECFYHTHDVAVVISIQGVNPITGQKMVKEKALCLEQYHKQCPIHNAKFQQDRYCPDCGFKWPGQNYLATTGTPEMMLWLDGFRSQDGKVRQYIFTEEEMRGIAAQSIGKDRVYAIGIAFYLSKHKKPYTTKRPEERKQGQSSGSVTMTQPMFASSMLTSGNLDIGGMGSTARKGIITCDCSNDDDNLDMDMDCLGIDSDGDDGGMQDVIDQLNKTANDPNKTIVTNHAFDPNDAPRAGSLRNMRIGGAIGGTPLRGRKGSNVSKPDIVDSRIDRTVYQLGPEITAEEQAKMDADPTYERFYTLNSNRSKIVVKPVTPVKKFEIGAGALISQDIYDDPKMMSYWEEEPAGMIFINYCDEAMQKKIIDGGRRADEKDGFMKDMKVGG